MARFPIPLGAVTGMGFPDTLAGLPEAPQPGTAVGPTPLPTGATATPPPQVASAMPYGTAPPPRPMPVPRGTAPGMPPPGFGTGLLRTAQGVLSRLAQAAPVAVQAGYGDMRGAMATLEMGRRNEMQQQYMARQAAYQEALNQVQPDLTTEQGVREFMRISHAYGFGDQAIPALNAYSAYRQATMGQVRKPAEWKYGTRMGPNGEEVSFRYRTNPRTGEAEEEIMARGPTPQPGTPDYGQVSKMGADYGKRGGDAYQAISEAWNRIDAAYGLYQNATTDAEKAQAYQAMNVGLQKILDPGSVVRESEFARTENFQSLGARFETWKERLATGSVGPELIEGIKSQADALYDRSTKTQRPRYESFEQRASRFGFDPADVLVGYQRPTERMPGPMREGPPEPGVDEPRGAVVNVEPVGPPSRRALGTRNLGTAQGLQASYVTPVQGGMRGRVARRRQREAEAEGSALADAFQQYLGLPMPGQ